METYHIVIDLLFKFNFQDHNIIIRYFTSIFNLYNFINLLLV